MFLPKNVKELSTKEGRKEPMENVLAGWVI